MISRIFPSNHRCPPSVGASTCKAASCCRRCRCTAAAAAEQDLVGQAAGCDLIGACSATREPWLGLGSGLDRCAVPATTQLVASVVFMPSSLFQWHVGSAMVPMRNCQGFARPPTPDISLLSAPCRPLQRLAGLPTAAQAVFILLHGTRPLPLQRTARALLHHGQTGGWGGSPAREAQVGPAERCRRAGAAPSGLR